MKTLCPLVLVLTVLSSAISEDDALVDDAAITERVDEAVKNFTIQAGVSRQRLLDRLSDAADRAQRSGDLALLTTIKTERQAFSKSGLLPSSVSVMAFERRMLNVRRSLIETYKNSVESYTRANNLEAARHIQQQLDIFRHRGLLQNHAVGLIDDQLEGWQPNNDSIAHWSIQGDVLRFDGSKGEKATLFTKRSYHNFSFRCEWRIGPGGDSGIFLRGVPQVQIWDHTRGNGRGIGSGGLFNNRIYADAPTEIADNAVGRWNTMAITLIGDRVSVNLNGTTVTDNIRMENHPKRKKPLPDLGPIGLQAFHSVVEFRNLTILELP